MKTNTERIKAYVALVLWWKEKQTKKKKKKLEK